MTIESTEKNPPLDRKPTKDAFREKSKKQETIHIMNGSTRLKLQIPNFPRGIHVRGAQQPTLDFLMNARIIACLCGKHATPKHIAFECENEAIREFRGEDAQTLMNKMRQGHCDLFRALQRRHPETDTHYTDAMNFAQKEQQGGDDSRRHQRCTNARRPFQILPSVEGGPSASTNQWRARDDA